MSRITKYELASELMDSVCVMSQNELREEMEALHIPFDSSVSNARAHIKAITGGHAEGKSEIKPPPSELKSLVMSGAIFSYLTDATDAGREEEILQSVFASASASERDHITQLLEKLRTISEKDIAEIQELIRAFESK